MSCESVLCVMIKEKKEKDKKCFRFFFLEILEQPIGTCNLLLFLYFWGGVKFQISHKIIQNDDADFGRPCQSRKERERMNTLGGG